MNWNDPAGKPVLVIGCGNDLRGDDAAGRIAVELAACEFPCCRTLSVIQLLPEHAEAIAEAGLFILIDAAENCPPGVVACEPLVIESSHETSHGLGLQQIISLARDLYHHAPNAYCIRIGAESFAAGEPLSSRVRGAMPVVMEYVRQLVEPICNCTARRAC